MLVIANVATQDAYVDALTLISQRGGGRLAFVVANAAVLMQLQPLYDKASGAAEFGPEFLLTPSNGMFDNISGVRFRSAVAGTPAQVIAQLYEENDPLPQGATPFTFAVSQSGQTGGVQTGGLLNVQYFTTPGGFTYTPTPGTQSIIVEVQGGGGGGGSCGAASSGATSAGGGGGGGYCRRRIVGPLAANYTGTCGGAGAGGTAGAAGATGGFSQFDPTGVAMTGNGGQGAAGVNAAGVQGGGGAEGAAAGGDISFGTGSGNSGANAGGGMGGGSYFGGGGGGGSNSAGLNGRPARAYGAGGGGGNGAAVPGANGGQGAQGIVIVWEYA